MKSRVKTETWSAALIPSDRITLKCCAQISSAAPVWTAIRSDNRLYLSETETFVSLIHLDFILAEIDNAREDPRFSAIFDPF